MGIQRVKSKEVKMCYFGVLLFPSICVFGSPVVKESDMRVNIVLNDFLSKKERFSHPKVPEYVVGNTTAKVPKHEDINNDAKLALAYNKTRIFCLVIIQQPYSPNVSSSINETWGKRCNKLMFMSYGRDSSFPVEKITTTLAFEYLYEKHRHDADWFITVNDNTYVIVENLRNMLSEYKKENASYFNFDPKTKNEGYKDINAGFVLNIRALRRFKNFNRVSCNKYAIEDNIGACLKILKIKNQDSRDSLHRERFLPSMPEHSLFPNKAVLSTRGAFNMTDNGFECCSNTAVAFNQVNSSDMYVLDYLLYKLRPYSNGSTSSIVTESKKIIKNTPKRLAVKKDRLLCWIMTCPANHVKKAMHVKNTWGKRCDKLLFMSTSNDSSLPTISLPVEEGRDHLWSKTKAAFKYIYENYRTKADWFLKADDDTYVVVENLKYMLSEYDSKDLLYFGFRFRLGSLDFMSGGAGYVLSRAAFYRLMNIGMPNNTFCSDNDTFKEDVQIGLCLKRIGVPAVDTRDSQKRGRFFPFQPYVHLFHDTLLGADSWFHRHLYYPNTNGLDCCSEHAITFHHMKAHEIYATDYLLYYLKPRGY